MSSNSVLTCLFEQCNHLFAAYAWESFEKLVYRIACLQVIEKTLYRDASSGKNRIAAKNFGVLRYDAAHNTQNTA